MSAISVEQLVKQFPGEPRPAVNGVSFTVERGEFVVLLGPSGCGKTTLLKMINRLYEPDSGRILMDNVDTRATPVTELRRRIGYVIQQSGLFPHMRVEQNIAVVPQLLGWERQRIDARIDELLELVGLPGAYRTRFPRQLSGGEQQRVGLARALAADPAILLMDEPFGALDAITRTRLQDELSYIQRRLHKTILFVTHDIEEALRLADRILILSAGSVVQYDAPLRILSAPADNFVSELVGADDTLRRMSLLTVAAVLHANGTAQLPDSAPTVLRVSPETDLRRAVGLLLENGAERLDVIGTDGEQLGSVGLAEIRALLRKTEN